jgi:hypothetical protein
VFAWLDETFALAERIHAPGVYISMQADPLFEVAATDQRRAGFNDLIEAVRAHAVKFGREVVLAHGDSHMPRIDKPLMSLLANPNPALPPAANMRRVENFTRIENYGPPDTHWLRVTVDPDGRQVFKTELMTVAKNRNTFAP